MNYFKTYFKIEKLISKIKRILFYNIIKFYYNFIVSQHLLPYIWAPYTILVTEQQEQGGICETRKGPNRPPIPRGIYFLVYAHVSKNSCFYGILDTFDHFRWSNLAKTVKKHIYRPRPFI